MHESPKQSLNQFFNPRSVVVIGVSTNPAKLGYGIAYNLVNCGFQGALYFVNPKGGSLFSRPVYQNVNDIPEAVDLAVILIPSHHVPSTLKICGEKGIKGLIIASGGFREVGEKGTKLEDECLQIARRFDMRLMGPNCIGLMDTHLPLDTTFLPPPTPPAGDIAFISHSGAICAAVVDWSRGQGFGFSRLVSLGNQVDVTETEVLGPVAEDENTKVVTLYLEGVSDGRKFLQVANKVTPHTPVIVLKVGRTRGGRQAATSHTGALAGREAAFEAAFRRAGVLRARTAEEMFDWARALAWSLLPKGPHVAILTNAGGPGVMAADAIEEQGLRLASLSQQTRNTLRDLLSDAASVRNPVDMLASATPQQYAQSLRLLLADEGVDAVLIILPPPPMFSAGGVARQLIPIIQNSAKPVLISVMGHGLVQEALAYLRGVHIPAFTFPESAASALAALFRRFTFLSRQSEKYNVPTPDQKFAFLELKDEWLSQAALGDLIGAYNIPAPKSILARSEQEIIQAAQAIGLPIALKIEASEIAHKSDVGGVRLNLRSTAEVKAAYHDLLSEVGEARPAAHISGVLVQQMISIGQDVIVGMKRDAQFGPLLMFGSGGVEVEGLKDVAFALAPLTTADGQWLLQNTWAGRKLDGYRNIKPGDKAAVLDVLARLGQIALDYPQIAEIEINPLRVLQDGALALDVRARPGIE